jgi:hypothetical protein
MPAGITPIWGWPAAAIGIEGLFELMLPGGKAGRGSIARPESPTRLPVGIAHYFLIFDSIFLIIRVCFLRY